MRMTWNDAALTAQIRQKARTTVTAATSATKARARSNAPVVSGRYRAGIDDEIAETETTITGRVNAKELYSIWVEIGAKGRPGKAVLATAVAPAQAELLDGLQK